VRKKDAFINFPDMPLEMQAIGTSNHFQWQWWCLSFVLVPTTRAASYRCALRILCIPRTYFVMGKKPSSSVPPGIIVLKEKSNQGMAVALS